MNTTEQTDTVRFTTKGQVVIPLRLRKLFQIGDGTRAIVLATSEGILLKPVTAALIKRGRGIARRKPDDRPFDQWWAEYKADEKALEEAKYARCTGGSR
jgi:AbrB family looped-hinge helix DNA binding protein